ncbi:hypothetical protein J4426_00355 [Candidatus Woesearchaeota archaeon]|nr:hypothetical protein [Candidatus Woesearchaeota archaeon]
MSVTKGLFKLLIGIILVIASLWIAVTYNGWGQATLNLIQGSIILLVILIGLVILVIGLTDLKA